MASKTVMGVNHALSSYGGPIECVGSAHQLYPIDAARPGRNPRRLGVSECPSILCLPVTELYLWVSLHRQMESSTPRL